MLLHAKQTFVAPERQLERVAPERLAVRVQESNRCTAWSKLLACSAQHIGLASALFGRKGRWRGSSKRSNHRRLGGGLVTFFGDFVGH